MLKRKPIRILISLLVAAITLIYFFMFRQFYVRQLSPFEEVKAFYAIGDILNTSGIDIRREFHILPQSGGFLSRYAYDISGDIFFYRYDICTNTPPEQVLPKISEITDNVNSYISSNKIFDEKKIVVDIVIDSRSDNDVAVILSNSLEYESLKGYTKTIKSVWGSSYRIYCEELLPYFKNFENIVFGDYKGRRTKVGDNFNIQCFDEMTSLKRIVFECRISDYDRIERVFSQLDGIETQVIPEESY